MNIIFLNKIINITLVTLNTEDLQLFSFLLNIVLFSLGQYLQDCLRTVPSEKEDCPKYSHYRLPYIKKP